MAEINSRVNAFVEDTNVVAEIGTDGSSVEPLRHVMDEGEHIQLALQNFTNNKEFNDTFARLETEKQGLIRFGNSSPPLNDEQRKNIKIKNLNSTA